MGRQIYDVSGNVIRVAHTDASEEGRVAFETIEDLEPIIDSAAALREHVTRNDTFRHVARVPLVVYERAIREGWHDDDDAWKKWLNSAEGKAFRVWEGSV